MSGHLAAVLGTGQTKHVAKREDVSIAGLVREAADRALEDAGVTYADIDAVVIGKAPDMFEGVMMPELYLAEALGSSAAIAESDMKVAERVSIERPAGTKRFGGRLRRRSATRKGIPT